MYLAKIQRRDTIRNFLILTTAGHLALHAILVPPNHKGEFPEKIFSLSEILTGEPGVGDLASHQPVPVVLPSLLFLPRVNLLLVHVLIALVVPSRVRLLVRFFSPTHKIDRGMQKTPGGRAR